jgi:glycosyltransferase involved in cell wall biosynthesis
MSPTATAIKTEDVVQVYSASPSSPIIPTGQVHLHGPDVEIIDRWQKLYGRGLIHGFHVPPMDNETLLVNLWICRYLSSSSQTAPYKEHPWDSPKSIGLRCAENGMYSRFTNKIDGDDSPVYFDNYPTSMHGSVCGSVNEPWVGEIERGILDENSFYNLKLVADMRHCQMLIVLQSEYRYAEALMNRIGCRCRIVTVPEPRGFATLWHLERYYPSKFQEKTVLDPSSSFTKIPLSRQLSSTDTPIYVRGYTASSLSDGLTSHSYYLRQILDQRVVVVGLDEIICDSRPYIQIITTVPDMIRYERKPVNEYRIYFTLFESTRIPKKWVELLDRYGDEIWTTHDFLKGAFKLSGCQVPVTEILSLGKHYDFSSYDIEKRSSEFIPFTSKRYTFTIIQTAIYRKAIPKTIETFIEAFRDNDNVQLLVICSKYGDPSEVAKIRQLVGENSNIIFYYLYDFNPETIKYIYENTNCVLALTEGEGWGYGMREAIEFGLPVIYTNMPVYDGLAEKWPGLHPIPADLVPARYSFTEEDCGEQWAFKRGSAIDAMRKVYEDNTRNSPQPTRRWDAFPTWYQLSCTYNQALRHAQSRALLKKKRGDDCKIASKNKIDKKRLIDDDKIIQTTIMVDRCYKDYLFRPADGDGLHHYVGSIVKGDKTVDDVRNTLLRCDERYSKIVALGLDKDSVARREDVVNTELHRAHMSASTVLFVVNQTIDAIYPSGFHRRLLDLARDVNGPKDMWSSDWRSNSENDRQLATIGLSNVFSMATLEDLIEAGGYSTVICFYYDVVPEPLVNKLLQRGVLLINDTNDILSINRQMKCQLDRAMIGPKIENIDELLPSQHNNTSCPNDEFSKEVKVLGRYDLVLSISENEHAKLQSEKNGITSLYLPLKCRFQGDHTKEQPSGNPVYVAYNNIFNVHGLLMLTNSIVPRIIALGLRKFTIDVVGSIRDAIETDLFKRHVDSNSLKYLNFLGKVQDLDRVLKEATFTICPLLWGTGSKVKIVDSLCWRRPVIAFKSQVSDGLVVDGINGYCCDTAKEFADAFVKLTLEGNGSRTLLASLSYGNTRVVEAYNAKYARAIKTLNSIIKSRAADFKL